MSDEPDTQAEDEPDTPAEEQEMLEDVEYFGAKEDEPEFRSTLDTPGIARPDAEEAQAATRTNEPGETEAEDDDE